MRGVYPHLDAFKESDLLRAHGIMMQALVENVGQYRKGGVGVFSDEGCVHISNNTMMLLRLAAMLPILVLS